MTANLSKLAISSAYTNLTEYLKLLFEINHI
jgi:hypothetical protein